jgi:hypothetical protein
MLIGLVTGTFGVLLAETSNEAFLKELVFQNWLKLETNVPVLKAKSLAIVAADSVAPIERLVAAHFREIAFDRNKKPVFAGETKNSEWLVRLWVTRMNLWFEPLHTGWLKEKKWLRKGALENRFEIVNPRNHRLIWVGKVRSVRADTLSSGEMESIRTGSPDFLRGTLVQKKSSLWKIVQLIFLMGVSASIVGLFYTIRTG